jgi:AraC family transcriptional regulator
MRGGTAQLEHEAWWHAGRIYAACKTWQGHESELVHARPQHSLVLTLSGGTSLTGNKISTVPRYEGADRPGAVSFVPAGAERRGWYRDANMRFAALLVDPSIVDVGTPEPFTNRHDRVLEVLLRDLADELATGDASELYVAHVATLAVLRAARRPSRTGRALSRRERDRVLDYIEARLDAHVTLAELGAVVGMTADHFARRFKATMRVAPYRYVLERRIARAGALLVGGQRPADVAFALGFASQSHFTRAFARVTGTTPAAWRRR